MALYASELRKAVTHPLVLLGAVGSFVCVPTVAVALTAPEGLLRALQLGQIFAVLIAMGAVGQEYESSSLRTSLLCSPQRLRLLSVKLTALATVVVGAAVGSMAIGSLALRVSAGEFGLPGPRSSLLAVFSWAGMSFVGAALAILRPLPRASERGAHSIDPRAVPGFRGLPPGGALPARPSHLRGLRAGG